MRSLFTAALFTSASLLAATTAQAQDAPDTAAESDVVPQPEEDAAEDVVEEPGITVTGSRVATSENSPTPLTILPTEEFLKLQPTTVTDALALMPAMMGSQSTSSRPGGGQRNGAAAYLSLRNMGDLRTLVLLDGQRVVPTINSNQAQVDASIVPQLLLERVDLVTGGVSAVYGSDGVSGVINFVTDRDFNGVKLQGNSGVSTYGDAQTWDVGIAAGTGLLDGRLHVEASYQHLEDDGVVDRRNSLDRDIYAANIGQAGTGSATNPFFNVPDARISNATFGGLIISSSLASIVGQQFTSPTTLGAFNHGLIPLQGGTLVPFGSAGALASANVESGGDGAYYASSSIKHRSSADQAFGRIDFDVTDGIHFWAQVAWSQLKNGNQFRSAAFISNNTTGNLRFNFRNPYLWQLANVGTAIRNNPNGTLGVNILLNNAPYSFNETEALIAQAGLEGELGDRFDWTLGASKSRSTINSVDPLNFRRDKLAAALDAVDVGLVTTGTANGQIACHASTAYAGHPANPNFAGCVPLNVFGGYDDNAAAWDWLYETTFNKHRTRLETLNAAITGEPFDTWAGPVKVALSGELRRIRWDVESNADPLEPVPNCDGISFLGTSTTTRLNCVAPTYNSAGVLTNTPTAKFFNNSFAAQGVVSQSVKEAALEVQVPLLQDVPFAQSFSVTGAVRLTHYSTSGSVTTWKAGADWHLNDDIRFRATRSRDIRAPNLFELFSSVKRNCANTAVDLLTSTTYTNICNTERPNANLTPELADTFTVGTVLTPSFIPGLSLTVDYYSIKIKDVVFLLQGFNGNFLANCAAIQGQSQPCQDLVTRTNWTSTTNNPITATESRFYNVAAQETWGIDFEGRYSTDIAGRDVDLRALVAYQPKLEFDQGPLGVQQYAGAYNLGTNRFGASPKWRVTGIAAVDLTDDITFTWLQRWRSGLRANLDPAVNVLIPRLPSFMTSTVNLSYRFAEEGLGDGEFFLNVRNLFNEFPTAYYSGQVSQPSSQPFLPEGDDTLGRYFTAGIRLKF